jgi:hypothetical protein
MGLTLAFAPLATSSLPPQRVCESNTRISVEGIFKDFPSQATRVMAPPRSYGWIGRNSLLGDRVDD